MTRPTLAQADLFGDDDEDHSPSLWLAWSGAMPAKRRRVAVRGLVRMVLEKGPFDRL